MLNQPKTLSYCRLAGLLAVIAYALSGCAVQSVRPPADADAQACLNLFTRTDDAIERAGVRDAQATRITGFPHLRVDRLQASFRDELPNSETRRAWLNALAQLDAEARRAELANLSAHHRSELAPQGASAPDRLAASLDRCRARLIEADAADADRFSALRASAQVPDDYSAARRIAGLYAITRLPFAAGVRKFEHSVTRTFSLPLADLPVTGALQTYVPSGNLHDTTPRDRAIGPAAAHTLHIPQFEPAQLHQLALSHAPLFEIDEADHNDRIGAPYWPLSGPARVDSNNITVFYQSTYTRVGDQMLLQLVYTAWFPARPLTGPLDLLGGHLDGLVWRVTLAPDGEPLVFDSMHPCGCYHFFFPTERVRARPAPASIEEWRFTPQSLPRQPRDQQVVLRVAAGSHYLERVRYTPRATAAAGARPYSLESYNTLRSLPKPDGTRRSLFDPNGFVAGSERLERFLFWPMGIANPGAMRQWGRHATAFVGRRHFDDPRLIDERFAIIE